MTIKLFSSKIDGRYIAYSSETEFLVQLGKGKKGSYKTRFSIVGNLERAVFHFNCINIGKGYKKRLLMSSCSTKPVLIKQTSE